MAIAVSVLLTGCANNSMLYEWGSYQSALINYNKNADKAEFEKELRESIAAAEAESKVPPGLYAELGYLLYSNGEMSEARNYFAKERDLFPESAGLMTKMLEGAQSAEHQSAGAIR